MREIYVVDSVPSRLALVENVEGAIAIDMSQGDPVEQILARRKEHVERVQNLQRIGKLTL